MQHFNIDYCNFNFLAAVSTSSSLHFGNDVIITLFRSILPKLKDMHFSPSSAREEVRGRLGDARLPQKKKTSTTPGIPRRSPIQVLTGPDVA